MKKLLALLLTVAMMLTMLVGCGNNSQTGGTEGGLDTSKTVKMGILISDATSAEALAFQNYYREYIGKQYNVELIYSDVLVDAAGEKSAIDTMITNNCKAIISFSSFDRAAQIQQCEDAGVYYAVATGTLTNEEYETYKTYEYYVGAIGPSLEVEYQTGYYMAKHFLDKGKTNYAIFGGAIPYYTEMHIYRAAGMLTAMVEAGGVGANYKGATTKEAIVAQIFADGAVEVTSIGNVNIVGYVGGYDMTDAWWGSVGQLTATPNLEVILAVGNGSDFFGTGVANTDIEIGSVDAYAETYGKAMEGDSLHYLAGKFSASIGPIFIAAYRAALGSPLRTEGGNAFALSPGYWVATSAEEFNEFYAVDSSIESPAYTKEILDTLLTIDYEGFRKFVGKYTLQEIRSMK